MFFNTKKSTKMRLMTTNDDDLMENIYFYSSKLAMLYYEF